MRYSSFLKNFPAFVAICACAAISMTTAQEVNSEKPTIVISDELRERLERLPQEKSVVSKKAFQIASESKSVAGEVHIISHWKPLLIALIADAEGLEQEAATKRYDAMMKHAQLLGSAKWEAKEGLVNPAGFEYAKLERIATENLLVHYVRLVMLDNNWSFEDWEAWRVRWQHGEVPVEEGNPELDGKWEEFSAIKGNWRNSHESDFPFAYAEIANGRLVFIWQEQKEGPVHDTIMEIYDVNSERIYFGPNDVGLSYGYFTDETGRDILTFEVKSDNPELRFSEVDLFRLEREARHKE